MKGRVGVRVKFRRNRHQDRVGEGTVVDHPDVALVILGEPGGDRELRMRLTVDQQAVEAVSGRGLLIVHEKAVQVGPVEEQAVTPGGEPDPALTVDQHLVESLETGGQMHLGAVGGILAGVVGPFLSGQHGTAGSHRPRRLARNPEPATVVVLEVGDALHGGTRDDDVVSAFQPSEPAGIGPGGRTVEPVSPAVTGEAIEVGHLRQRQQWISRLPAESVDPLVVSQEQLLRGDSQAARIIELERFHHAFVVQPEEMPGAVHITAQYPDGPVPGFQLQYRVIRGEDRERLPTRRLIRLAQFGIMEGETALRGQYYPFVEDADAEHRYLVTQLARAADGVGGAETARSGVPPHLGEADIGRHQHPIVPGGQIVDREDMGVVGEFLKGADMLQLQLAPA